MKIRQVSMLAILWLLYPWALWADATLYDPESAQPLAAEPAAEAAAQAQRSSPMVSGLIPGSDPPRRYVPLPPPEASICGEPVPLSDPFIAEQLDREFTIMVHDQPQVIMWLKRGARFFPYISEQLKAAGLPDDLKYLAVAESSLLHRIVSPAGATGVWQFMDATGRRYGLTRNKNIDDRRNPEKSTQAAIAYLKDLYKLFNSWPLAMAAYNCGEQRVLNEIKEQGQSNYYELYLPQETMRYVFRIIAAKIILENPEAYGYHLPSEQRYQRPEADLARLKLAAPLHLRTVAQITNSSVRRLRELNPQLLTHTLPSGSIEIYVPKNQGANLQKALSSRPRPPAAPPAAAPAPAPKQRPAQTASSKQKYYVVKAGDTLSAIARQAGCSIDSLRRANNLKGNFIKPGQKLIIPD